MFRQRKPNERPLPLPKQAKLSGPYADDAKRLINVEVLLSKPADHFYILEIGRNLVKWRRQARLLKFCPTEELDLDPASWDGSNLYQLQRFISTTPPANRCQCSNGQLKQPEDHWPECPFGQEFRILQFEEQHKKAQEVRIAALTHNLVHVLTADVMEALGAAEIQYIHALFEREKNRRGL